MEMDKDGLLISTLIVSICISPYIGYRDSGRRNICLLGVPTKKRSHIRRAMDTQYWIPMAL